MGTRRRGARLATLVVGVWAVATSCVPPVLFSGDASIARVAGAPIRCAPPRAGQEQRAAPSDVELAPLAVIDAVAFATVNASASVRVYRRDCLVAASGRDGSTAFTPANLWSATKGIVGTLVGRAVTMGLIGLDDPIGRYLPEADAPHAAITVRQLLTQSSGLQLAWVTEIAPNLPDTVTYALRLPFARAPGTYFEYGQTTVTLLAYVLERAVGRDLQDFAQAELFGPLGIPRDRWYWTRDRAGHTAGYAYLSMAPVDLASIGSLLLHEGAWDGRQLIDRRYVQEMAAPSPANPGYGFLTWTNRGEYHYGPSVFVRPKRDRRWIASAPPDLFALSGLGDQLVIMVPSLDMVVVRTGFLPLTQGFSYEFFRRLLAGLTDVAYQDPGPYRPESSIDLSDWSKVFDLRLWPWGP